jgi:hypothetical protein
MDEDKKKELMRLEKKADAVWDQVLGKTDEGEKDKKEKQEDLKSINKFLEKELGDDAEFIATDKEEMDYLLELSGPDRINRIAELKAKMNKMHATPGPLDEPVVEDTPEIKSIKEKLILQEARHKAQSELAAKKAQARALFHEQLKKRLGDPETIQDALDEYDKSIHDSEQKSKEK